MCSVSQLQLASLTVKSDIKIQSNHLHSQVIKQYTVEFNYINFTSELLGKYILDSIIYCG